MTTKEKYVLAEAVINYALKNGAQEVSVSIDESRSNEIEIRDKQIDRLTESNRNSLTIRLYVDKKYSAHSTNRLKKDELFKFTGEAIAATRYLAEDQFRTLPEPELYYKGGGADPGIFDSKLETIDAKNKIEIASQLLDEAFGKDERIVSVTSYYYDSISNSVMITSNGFAGDSARTDLAVYVTVSVKSENGRPSDYWYESALFYDKLIKTGIGKKALERVIQKIEPKKISSGKYPMIVENRIATGLLNPVYNALQGYSIYQKQSFLAGKEDKPVASEIMSVEDDPTLPSEPGSRLFDNEGLAAVKRTIIERGTLRSFYIDTYYGKKLGMKPTSGSSSNILFKKGEKDLQGLIKSVKKGILVTGFNGGNCNGSTGDFSYGIEGFYIENGKIIHPVNEMNITGNMNDLWFRLVEAGNDYLEGRSVKVPSLLIDNVDFSGI
ncbi:MAG: TldD/PmbA family protein [Bacteroidales bacterium]